MKRYGSMFAVFAAALFLGGFIQANAIAQGLPQGDAPGLAVAAQHVPVCPPGLQKQGEARCFSQVVVDSKGKPINPFGPCCTTAITPYGPVQFRTAYNLNAYAGSPSQIIGIVDAFDDPNIQADLDTYSARFGIASLPACVVPIALSPVACFQKSDQRGGTTYPAYDHGWALEVALDVEVSHAVCPECSILLVEGDTNSFQNLATAVDTAVSLGATVVSNSYGSSGEFSTETTYDSHYDHPGVAITASTGDAGYGVEYPAAATGVVAVGGTSLYVNADNTYNRETVWKGAGSGCSVYEAVKPAGQPTIGGCTKRIVADVSADADPNTGAAVYDSSPYIANTIRGWVQVGGTSLSSPIIAAVYALAGGVPAGVEANTIPYASTQYGVNMHDVTSGSNAKGGSCKNALCMGAVGFDGPTGLGTPNGIGAF